MARRHGLAPGARFADVVAAADALGGLHATDPATVFLAARARVADLSVAAVEAALYEQRTLVRMLGMRRTMFVVPAALAGVIHASSTLALIPGERKRFVAAIEESRVADDGARWLAETEAATYAAELGDDVPALKSRTPMWGGKPYAASPAVSSRIMFLLAAEGRIVRGRPGGTWTSSLYRWAPSATWLPAPMEQLEPDVAAARLVRRWLRAFGPGTLADLKWWTGWTMGLVKRALAQLDVVECSLADGRAALLLAEDAEPVAATGGEPWVALLPALDPAPMGWQERAWYLGEHRAALFDRSGNIGPTVWCDGRIVGGWAQRKADGEVVVRLLEDVGGEAFTAIAEEAERLRTWIGDVRVTPRFRTPVERELAG